MSFGRVLMLGFYISAIAFAGMAHAADKKADNKANVKESTANFAQPNPKPPKGGTITYNMSAEPPTIHPIASADYYSQTLFVPYAFDILAARDLNTYEYYPRLAEKWEISKDNKIFTFHLNIVINIKLVKNVLECLNGFKQIFIC